MRVFTRALLVAIIAIAACIPATAQSSRPMYIYVPNGDTNVGEGILSVFSVNTTTGALTPVQGSPFAVDSFVYAVAVDPAGRFVYAGTSGGIWAFSVDPTTGILTQLPNSPFVTGVGGGLVAIDQTGRFLYTEGPQVYPNPYSLAVLAIDPVTGNLSPISSSPFPQAESPAPLAVDPPGNFLYFANQNALSVDRIDFETGALTFTQNAPYGNTPASIAIDPLDRFLALNGTILFAINPLDGSIDLLPGETATYTNPSAGSSVFDTTGKFLYASPDGCTVQNPSCEGMYGYQVDPQYGTLTPISGSPFTTIYYAWEAPDPSGQFLYAISGGALYGFAINPTTGALTPLSSPPGLMSYSSSTAPSNMVISWGPNGVANPAPAVLSVSPSSVVADSGSFTLTVTGSNFVPGAIVYFSGRGKPTTYVSPTELTATVTNYDIAYGGTAVVFAFNPLPGGGVSSSVELPVPNPAPTIATISSSAVVAGASGFTLTVTGTFLQPTSVVTFNGTPLTTTFVNYDEVQAVVPAASLAIPGTVPVAVTTPAINGLGGGTSAALSFVISPANIFPPTTIQLGPGSITAGSAGFKLVITGTNFTAGSVVTFGGVNVTVINWTATVLDVTIPASAITTPGMVPVVVSTAGGTSAPLIFYVENPAPTAGGVVPPIIPAGGAALTLSVSGTGFTSASMVLVNGSARVTTYVSSTSLQATLLASDISHGGTLTITVSTPGPGGGVSAPITLAVADYAVNVGSSTSSIAAGQVASFALTIAPSNGAYGNPVTLTVSGLPAGAAASFLPSATVTPGGTATSVTLSISTTARAYVPSGLPHEWPWSGIILIWLAGLALIMAGISLSESQVGVRRPAGQFLLVAALLLAVAAVACSSGSGGSSTTQTANPSGGTPAGTYPVVVTATSGADVHTTTVTLTVM